MFWRKVVVLALVPGAALALVAAEAGPAGAGAVRCRAAIAVPGRLSPMGVHELRPRHELWAGGAGRRRSSFDNVFVDRASHASFLKTGHWPEGAMFVLEIRGQRTHGSINKNGAFQGGEPMAIEVHLKDQHYEGGWAFFSFDRRQAGGENPDQRELLQLPPAECRSRYDLRAILPDLAAAGREGRNAFRRTISRPKLPAPASNASSLAQHRLGLGEFIALGLAQAGVEAGHRTEAGDDGKAGRHERRRLAAAESGRRAGSRRLSPRASGRPADWSPSGRRRRRRARAEADPIISRALGERKRPKPLPAKARRQAMSNWLGSAADRRSAPRRPRISPCRRRRAARPERDPRVCPRSAPRSSSSAARRQGSRRPRRG